MLGDAHSFEYFALHMKALAREVSRFAFTEGKLLFITPFFSQLSEVALKEVWLCLIHSEKSQQGQKIISSSPYDPVGLPGFLKTNKKIPYKTLGPLCTSSIYYYLGKKNTADYACGKPLSLKVLSLRSSIFLSKHLPDHYVLPTARLLFLFLIQTSFRGYVGCKKCAFIIMLFYHRGDFSDVCTSWGFNFVFLVP